MSSNQRFRLFVLPEGPRGIACGKEKHRGRYVVAGRIIELGIGRDISLGMICEEVRRLFGTSLGSIKPLTKVALPDPGGASEQDLLFYCDFDGKNPRPIPHESLDGHVHYISRSDLRQESRYRILLAAAVLGSSPV